MKQKSFRVIPFTNPSGEQVWQVYGRINGVRFRKNFADKIDSKGRKIESGKVMAKAFAEMKEVERLNSSSNIQTHATRLTADEIKDAERAMELLRGTGQTMTFAAEFFKRNWVPFVSGMTTGDAVKDYVGKRLEEVESGLIVKAHAKALRTELERFERHFEGRELESITTVEINDYLKIEGGGPKTWNNRRSILNGFFVYAVKEDVTEGKQAWCAANAVTGTVHHKRRQLGRKKGEAEVLSEEQARKLMEFLEVFEDGRMVNFFAVTLFGGIRPDFKNGEISKIRPEHFDLDHGQIIMPAWVSKIGETRSITIQPNLKAWLRKYPFDLFPIIPPNCKKLRLTIRKKFSLGHDVLRHSFCAFLYSKTKDLGDVARQAGNSADMIRTHYASYRQPEEVAKFWQIVPKE
jgi:integrase